MTQRVVREKLRRMAHPTTLALTIVAMLTIVLAGSSFALAQESASELAPAPAPQAPQTETPTQTQTQTPTQTQTQTQTQPQPQPQPQQPAPVFEQDGPGGVPTPPPGYGTTQQPTYGTPGVQPAPRLQLRQPQLDPQAAARIDALMQERNQIRVGGWIAMMAAGAATTAVSVLFAVAFAEVERDETGCSRCGDNTGTITFSAISILTAAVAVTGFLMFLRRAKKRRAVTQQIRDIRQQAIMRQQVALLEW